jgi:hypothetical protein
MSSPVQEVTGDLWDFHRQGAWIGIPTNCVLRANGEAVMGAGLAKQAAIRFPDFPWILGQQLQRGNADCFAWPQQRLMAIPTKSHWRDPSSLALIQRSIISAIALLDQYRISKLYCPRLGCGLGQLDWTTVHDRLAPLVDERFIFVSPPAT